MTRDPRTIALLLADVDGTLVTHEKVLTDRAKKAVADLKATGVSMASGPITISMPLGGRPLVMAKRMPAALRSARKVTNAARMSSYATGAATASSAGPTGRRKNGRELVSRLANRPSWCHVWPRRSPARRNRTMPSE